MPVTSGEEHGSMHEDTLQKPSITRRVSRTSTRAARVGSFALETLSRLIVDTSPRSYEARAKELAWVAENMCALHGVRAVVRGQVPSKAAVLVANHVSYFDPLVIASLVPVVPVAKREVADWPVVGNTCRKLGVQFVVRESALSGARVLRAALRALENDVSVLVFPEGTTTYGHDVLPFRRGIFGIAARASVPVIPVALRYEREDVAWVGDATFLPHYVRTMAQPCTRVSADFLPAIYAAPGLLPEQIAQAARLSIARALSSCAPMPTVVHPSESHARIALAS
jgi:1-acyl-sn-glycerol-3-phosphate acyltransferase